MNIEQANLLRFKIRWRKSTATWVIYKGGRVVESGFETEAAALDYLDRLLNK